MDQFECPKDQNAWMTFRSLIKSDSKAGLLECKWISLNAPKPKMPVCHS